MALVFEEEKSSYLTMTIPWLLALLWFLALVSKAIYYLYLWQIKEYRFDRFFALLREPRGYASIFTRSLAAAFFLLAISFVLPSKTLGILLFLLYAGEFAFWARSIIHQEAAFPVVTAKVFFLFLLSLASAGSLFFLFGAEKASSLQALLISDCALFFVVSFWVAAGKPFSFLAKQRLARKAQKKRSAFPGLIAVGITGSFGKTSTKEFLASILSHRYKVAKTFGHQNTEVGAARAILGMLANTDVFVAEMAAYRKGDIAEISSVVQPNVGIITGVGSQHLALFGDQKSVVETKFELARALPRGGILLVNLDSPLIKCKVLSERMRPQGECREGGVEGAAQAGCSKFKGILKNLKLITYSLRDKTATIYASDINETLWGLSFTVHAALPDSKETKQTMQVNLLGRHTVSNLLAAAACALCLGMTFKEVAMAMPSLKAFPRTLEPKGGPRGSLVIDDTYNVSLEGALAGLHVLSLARGKKIIVLTSLIELGRRAAPAHRRLGAAMEDIADKIIVTDRRHEEELKSKKTMFISDPETVLEEIGLNRLTRNDVILLEGRIPQEIVRGLCQT